MDGGAGAVPWSSSLAPVAETGEHKRLQQRLRREASLRRQRALAGLAGLALLAGLIAGAVSGGEDEGGAPTGGATVKPTREAKQRSGGLGDRLLAGQRMVAGWDGAEIPNGLKQLVSRGAVAGVILFEDNVTTDEETRAKIRSLQQLERPDELSDPLLVMVDQEGGQVQRVPGPPDNSAEGIGPLGPETALSEGVATGERLSSLGFNVDLAPVLDVATPGGAIDREQRSFSPDPELAAEGGLAFAEGLEQGGIIPAAKHFPGIGRAEENTDFAAQTIEASVEELRAVDILPFERFIDSGGKMVMTSFGIYPAFADRPAAFAREIVEGELRGRLGFEGVTITDGLGAKAAQQIGSIGMRGLAAAEAGNDLLLETDWRAARDVGRLLGRRLAEGELDREQFEQSVARVLALRSQL